MFDDLLEINRNENGDYYFIYEVRNVINHIKPGTKNRNEIIIVGIPKNKLKNYLNAVVKQKNIFPKE